MSSKCETEIPTFYQFEGCQANCTICKSKQVNRAQNWRLFWEQCELEWAEQQKKQELYDPHSNPCGGEPSQWSQCDGDCDNCSFSEDYNCLDGAYFEEDEE